MADAKKYIVMNKGDYIETLRDPRWQKKRLQILKRDKFRCKLCGDDKTHLQVHYKEYKNNLMPWEYCNSDLITLCEHCHNAVTIAKEDGGLNGLKAIKLKTETEGTYIKTYSRKGKNRVAFWLFKNNIYQDSFLIAISEIKSLLKVMHHE